MFLWADPTYELVGICFAVANPAGIPEWIHLPLGFGTLELMGRPDMFVNAVTAAVVDL